jgi:hypothetical protein
MGHPRGRHREEESDMGSGLDRVWNEDHRRHDEETTYAANIGVMGYTRVYSTLAATRDPRGSTAGP